MSLNVFSFSGNLGKDATVRQAGNTSVAGFSVAATSGFGDKKQTIWVDCSIWGKQAESGLIDYLKKGQPVAISGELGTREYEGKTYITCRVNSVTLMDKAEGGGHARAEPVQRAAPVSSGPSIDDSHIPF